VKVARIVLVAVSALLGGASPGLGDGAPHRVFTPDRIEWGPAPPGLPPGSEAAVLYGDPAKAGLFVLRGRLPAGYRIPAHTHPTDEIITVISGTFRAGMGTRLDPARVTAFPVGSVVVMPAGAAHYVVTAEETVIEVTGMGPFDLTYVDPAEDPRKQ
jgi:quercetin dioxygenase-like cupin family protein